MTDVEVGIEQVGSPVPDAAVEEAAPAAVPDAGPDDGPVVDDGEEYKLLPDGRILLAFEGKRWTLRRPRLGEYRHFRSMFLELAKVDGEDQIDHVIKWVEECFAALADRPLSVPVDDWPTWLVAGMSFGDWITHWRDVPLARGGPAGQ